MILRAARGDVQEVRMLGEPPQMPALGRRDREHDDAPLAALESVHGAHQNAAAREQPARDELALDADALPDERREHREVRRRDTVGDQLRDDRDRPCGLGLVDHALGRARADAGHR